MRILVIAAAIGSSLAVATIEVDETFQLSTESDRNRLLDYIETNSDLDAGQSVLSILAEGTEPPTFVDQDGDALTLETFALPAREEIDVDPADVLSAREPTDEVVTDHRTHGDESAIDDGVERAA